MPANSAEKMAFWSICNRLLEVNRLPGLRNGTGDINDKNCLSDVQIWWRWYQGELEMERAYAKAITRGRAWN